VRGVVDAADREFQVDWEEGALDVDLVPDLEALSAGQIGADDAAGLVGLEGALLVLGDLPFRVDSEEPVGLSGEAGEEIFAVALFTLVPAAEPLPDDDFPDAGDGADLLLIPGGHDVRDGDFVAGDQTKFLTWRGVGVEQGGVERCEDAEQADGKSETGDGQETAPAVSESVLEDQGKESHGRSTILNGGEYLVVSTFDGAAQAGDDGWMRRALGLARRAAEEGESPVGAVIVGEDGRLLAEAHNAPIGMADPTAHAEIVALRAAAKLLGNYRLAGTTMYVTLEPCVMCAGALVHARVKRLVFGARDLRFGGVRSKFKLADSEILNHRVEVEEGLMAAEATALLEAFFQARR